MCMCIKFGQNATSERHVVLVYKHDRGCLSCGDIKGTGEQQPAQKIGVVSLYSPCHKYA